MPVRHQAITWNNADLYPVGPSGTNFNEIQFEIWTKLQNFSVKKMHSRIVSARWQPFDSEFSVSTFNICASHPWGKCQIYGKGFDKSYEKLRFFLSSCILFLLRWIKVLGFDHLIFSRQKRNGILVAEGFFYFIIQVLWFLVPSPGGFNSSLPKQNGCHSTDNIFRCIFLNEKFGILIKISLKFVGKGPIDNNPTLV